MGDVTELRTVPEAVAFAARHYASSEALVDGDVRLTFSELQLVVDDASKAFIAAGIALGDRVAIWAPNIHEWVVAALGALGSGAAIVPLNTRFKATEAAYVLERSGAKMLMCVNGFLGNDYSDMIEAHLACLPALRHVVVLRGELSNVNAARTWKSFLSDAISVSDNQLHDRRALITGDTLSDIIFTSGTTGHPKGVMATHAQTVRTFTEWSGIVGLRHGDRYLIVNPFFHTFGYKAGFVSAILRGAAIVPLAVLDVPRMLQLISDESITTLPGPPTLYLSILNYPNRHTFDLSSLRLAVTGAAAVPVSMILRMLDELTFQVIVTGYGLTESTGVVTMCRPADDPELISQTSGRAIEGVDIQIVDDTGAQVDTGAAGEIMVRGYNVTPGYFNDPETTAATITADGWLHTGDIGTIDAQGYVRITDRKKDMYIMGGFNVYPAEVENTLMQHPSIAQVAVVGGPDNRMGETGWAFVIARPGHTVNGKDVIAWARDNMANYKVPRHVVALDALPTNASGKVLKTELRLLTHQGA